MQPFCNQSSSSNDVTMAICTTSCVLSMLGAMAIFWSYYRIPEIRNFVRALMLCLTVADFLTAAGYFIASLRYYIEGKQLVSDKLCTVQSFITTFSSLASFFFTMSIVVHIFVTVVTRRSTTGTARFFVIVNGISWLVPGTIVTTALLKQKLGKDDADDVNIGTGPWCWINIDRTVNETNPSSYYDVAKNSTSGSVSHLTSDTIMWMFLSGKGWEIACYLVTTSLYVLLKLHLYLRGSTLRLHDLHASLRNEDKNCMLVWLVLYLVRIWGTIRFFLAWFNIEHDGRIDSVLEKLQAFGDPSQSFFNFGLFCILDQTVRRNMFKPCCPNAPMRNDRTRLIEDNDTGQSGFGYGTVDEVDAAITNVSDDEDGVNNTDSYSEMTNTRRDTVSPTFFSVHYLASIGDLTVGESVGEQTQGLHMSWLKPRTTTSHLPKRTTV